MLTSATTAIGRSSARARAEGRRDLGLRQPDVLARRAGRTRAVGLGQQVAAAAEALADGKGVCQDHAHIFIAAAPRTIGVPARYITGYLVVGEEGLGGRAATPGRKPGSEALGWVGFDVANSILPDGALRAAGGGAPMRATQRRSRACARAGRRRKLDVAVEVQQQSAQQ